LATFSSRTAGSISFLFANGLIDSAKRVKTGAAGSRVALETAIEKEKVKKTVIH
jgi:hypothetical protein